MNLFRALRMVSFFGLISGLFYLFGHEHTGVIVAKGTSSKGFTDLFDPSGVASSVFGGEGESVQQANVTSAADTQAALNAKAAADAAAAEKAASEKSAADLAARTAEEQKQLQRFLAAQTALTSSLGVGGDSTLPRRNLLG